MNTCRIPKPNRYRRTLRSCVTKRVRLKRCIYRLTKIELDRQTHSIWNIFRNQIDTFLNVLPDFRISQTCRIAGKEIRVQPVFGAGVGS